MIFTVSFCQRCLRLLQSSNAATIVHGKLAGDCYVFPFQKISVRPERRPPSSIVSWYSTEAGKVTSGGKQQERWKWWSSVRNEWKILGTVAVCIISWYVNAREDRLQNRRQVQMDLVSRQLKELYGPLYGNRIVSEASYRAAMREHGGLQNYLKRAEEQKDSEMIKVWRAYVWNVLYPLDKQALDLIVNSSHLIADREFPEEFEVFLEHMAKMQFVMEHWKNGKGDLEAVTEFTDVDYLEETNSSGIGGSKPMIAHLRDRCRILRAKRLQYSEDLNVEGLSAIIVRKVFK